MKAKSKISGYIFRAAAVMLLFSCVIVAICSAINLPNTFPTAPAPQDDTVLGMNGHENASSVATPLIRRDRTLTFADRVAYQRAIEEVYWRHRIWPKENRSPKPPLDAVMSQAQLESKVADYLRESQALENYWQTPITPDQLQAEMERIASHTRRPEVLRELFAALGNDPFVIAECLARPMLAERLIAELYAHGLRFEGEFKQPSLTKVEAQVPVTMAAVSANYTLPVIVSDFPDTCTVPWIPTSLTNAPAARSGHTAVWTGSEMIVWGGGNGSSLLNTGGRYNPVTHSWTATSTTNALDARSGHTAVWTGSEMIVWGGGNGSSLLNTGGRYNPVTDSWTATSTTNAPAARSGHTAVWTGSEMIVWGGYGYGGSYFNTGGRYNPSNDSWTATSTNAPAGRSGHTAVWTGSEMIVWGGSASFSMFFRTGGRYDPSTDSWTTTSIRNAPAARETHTAVWTGSQMIVWGGYDGDNYLNTGGVYDLGSNSWTATSTANAPDARWLHAAVWTGSEMIVWGGRGAGDVLNTGARYNPSTDSWIATTTINAPVGREYHTAVWAGSEMIVWGGLGYGGVYLNTGGRYCPAAPAPTPSPTVSSTPTPMPTPPPQVVLYNQYNNPGNYVTVSATFTDSPSHNSDLADDFVVPAGQTWHVQSIDADGVYFNGTGPATDWNIFFYANNAGFPSPQIYSAAHQAAAQSGTTFTVNLPAPAVLNAGTYWVEIQANMTFSTQGEWGWTDRTVTSNNAAVWRNPGGGFGLCPSWSRRGATCNIDPSEPDQVYRLKGTVEVVTPTPFPTVTPRPLPTLSPRPTRPPRHTPTPPP